MDGELKKIKKLYGEDFAKLCRTLFSRILDDEGRLLEILLQTFAPSHSLYDELISQNRTFEFKGYIFRKAGIATPEKRDIDKTPEELLASAGYKLYRCKNDREVKSFKKYYAPGELLCTFRDSSRIKKNDIFFVVRDNVESIKREDFKYPEREDRYGTSVMSLQFDKTDGSLSIKNRYNHAVENPDATYANDLDAIVPGLTDSFAKYYGLDSRVDYSRYPDLHLAHYVQDEKGVAHRYNELINGIFFCENNVVINRDGIAVQYDKGRYELVGTFLIDKSSKTMTDLSGRKDSFANLFKDVEKIETEKVDGKHRNIIVTKTDGTYFTITVNKINTMIHYENKFQTEVEDGFLQNDTMLQKISLPNVKKIGRNFLYSNMKLKEIDFPELEEVGENFLKQSTSLVVASLPRLKKVDDFFLFNATSLKSVSFPELEYAGGAFMSYASALEFVNFPNLRELGDDALRQCVHLRSVELPSLEVVGDKFMRDNNVLNSIYVPSLRKIGEDFLFENKDLRAIDLPSAEVVLRRFMYSNQALSKINLPVVKKIGTGFLYRNEELREINLPQVESIENSFLYENTKLKTFSAPNLKMLGASALYNNKSMVNVDLPELEFMGEWTLHKNSRLKTVNIPRLREMSDCCLTKAGRMKKIRVSKRVVLPAYVNAKTIEEVGIKILEP